MDESCTRLCESCTWRQPRYISRTSFFDLNCFVQFIAFFAVFRLFCRHRRTQRGQLPLLKQFETKEQQRKSGLGERRGDRRGRRLGELEERPLRLLSLLCPCPWSRKPHPVGLPLLETPTSTSPSSSSLKSTRHPPREGGRSLSSMREAELHPFSLGPSSCESRQRAHSNVFFVKEERKRKTTPSVFKADVVPYSLTSLAKYRRE